MELDSNKIGVYKIIFPGGEFYIGSSWGKKGIVSRWKEHKSCCKNSPKCIQEIANIYGGWFNPGIKFVVLENTYSKENTLLREQEIIYGFWPDVDNKNPLLINKRRDILSPPCLGEFKKGKKLNEEQKKKISESRKEGFRTGKIIHPNLGKHLSKEHKEKIGQYHKGKDTWNKGKIGAYSINRGTNNPSAKIDMDVANEIRRLYSSGEFTMRELAGKFELADSTIFNIIRYKTWKE